MEVSVVVDVSAAIGGCFRSSCCDCGGRVVVDFLLKSWWMFQEQSL